VRNLKFNGWFQKISIPISRVASRNSEGDGGVTSTGIPRTWGVHWTGILKVWGGGQESNIQFGVVKSLKGKLIKNDLSKDDDSLINMRHIQLNQHAGRTFQWLFQYIGHKSDRRLFFDCFAQIQYCSSQQRVFSSYLADIIIETAVKLLHYIPCDAH